MDETGTPPPPQTTPQRHAHTAQRLQEVGVGVAQRRGGRGEVAVEEVLEDGGELALDGGEGHEEVPQDRVPDAGDVGRAEGAVRGGHDGGEERGGEGDVGGRQQLPLRHPLRHGGGVEGQGPQARRRAEQVPELVRRDDAVQLCAVDGGRAGEARGGEGGIHKGHAGAAGGPQCNRQKWAWRLEELVCSKTDNSAAKARLR